MDCIIKQRPQQIADRVGRERETSRILVTPNRCRRGAKVDRRRDEYRRRAPANKRPLIRVAASIARLNRSHVHTLGASTKSRERVNENTLFASNAEARGRQLVDARIRHSQLNAARLNDRVESGGVDRHVKRQSRAFVGVADVREQRRFKTLIAGASDCALDLLVFLRDTLDCRVLVQLGAARSRLKVGRRLLKRKMCAVVWLTPSRDAMFVASLSWANVMMPSS